MIRRIQTSNLLENELWVRETGLGNPGVARCVVTTPRRTVRDQLSAEATVSDRSSGVVFFARLHSFRYLLTGFRSLCVYIHIRTSGYPPEDLVVGRVWSSDRLWGVVGITYWWEGV